MFKFEYTLVEKYDNGALPDSIKEEFKDGFTLSFILALDLAFAPFPGLTLNNKSAGVTIKTLNYEVKKNKFWTLEIKDGIATNFGGFKGVVYDVETKLADGYTSYETHPKLKALIDSELLSE